MKHLQRNIFAATFLLMSTCSGAQAQRPSEIVKWSANVTGSTPKTVSATLTATIQDGWHVYAISQPSGGPTPLKISTPADSSYSLERPVAETTVVRHFDPNFNMETIYYLKTASFTLPMKGPGAAANDTVPIDVRFQACSDRLCLPPYTTHLSASLKRR